MGSSVLLKFHINLSVPYNMKTIIMLSIEYRRSRFPAETYSSVAFPSNQKRRRMQSRESCRSCNVPSIRLVTFQCTASVVCSSFCRRKSREHVPNVCSVFIDLDECCKACTRPLKCPRRNCVEHGSRGRKRMYLNRLTNHGTRIADNLKSAERAPDM